MGLTYTINLYFPRQHLTAVMRDIAALARSNDDDSITFRTPCRLPDGSTIHLPFTSHFESHPATLEVNGPGLELDTSLLFPIDAALEEYRSDNRAVHSYRAWVGCVYLTVTVGTRFVEFSFEAASTSMSHLFVASTSLRETFLEILNAYEGIYGVIDTDELQDCMLLSNPSVRLHVCRMMCWHLDEPFEVDEFVETVRFVIETAEHT